MQTDRTNPNNKLDIIIHDNEEGTCVLTDAANSGNRNVTKRTEKNLKYKNLTTEIQHKWDVKTKVIPVINQATGKHCKLIWKIPEQHTRQAQNQGATKEVILGFVRASAHARTHTHTNTYFKKYKYELYKTFNMGNNITLSINCKYRTAAKLMP